MAIKLRSLLFFGISALLATATWLVYKPGLSGPFVFDDLTNILLVNTTYLKSLDSTALYNTAWAVKSGPLSRPIAILSFGLNYYFTQLDVYYFKLTNLVIHLLAGYALYQLTYRLLARREAKTTLPGDTPLSIHYLALATCAIWLVHPLNLTSVLYVVQRMTSLSSLFMVLGLIGYVIGREQIIADQTRGYATISLSILCFGTLAIFTKEIGAFLPIYAILIEIYFFRLAASERLTLSFKRFWYGFFVVPLILALVIALAKSGSLLGLDAYQFRNFSLTERLLTESRILWFYLRLILFPSIVEMGTYHDDILISTDLLHPATTLLSVMGIGLLGTVAVIARKKATILSFGITWFLVGHSLESTVIPLELAHEHRNYLPEFGILLVLTYYITHTTKKASRTLKLRYLFLLAYASLLGITTHARATEWRDEWTLFNAEARNHPDSSRSHTSLAVLYFDNKMYPEAGQHFRKAAELQPKEIDFQIRLAQFEFKSKGAISEQTLTELEHRIQNYNFSPVSIWYYTGLLSTVEKKPILLRRTVEIFEKLAFKPGVKLDKEWQLIVYHTLSMYYDDLAQHDKAIRYYILAAELNPKAYYYIKAAIQYAVLGNEALANQMIIIVADKRIPVTKLDEQLLVDLDRILKHKAPNGMSQKGSRHG